MHCFARRNALGKLGRFGNVLASLERRSGITRQISPQRFIGYGGVGCTFCEQRLEIWDDEQINDGSAGRIQFRNILLKYGIDFLEVLGIRLRIQPNRFTQDTDACAFESTSVEASDVARRRLADAKRGDRILWIIAHHRVEHLSDLSHSSCHRTHLCRG